MREALTKIIATIGPSSQDILTIKNLVNSGADILRFNLKHSNYLWHEKTIKKVKKELQKLTKTTAILIDVPDGFKKFELSLFSLVDFVALSFVQKAKEVLFAKRKLPNEIKIISKIENMEGIRNFDEILEVSDGIMIGRGDLARQIPFEKLPFYQKTLIKKSAEKGKPVIVATEMLKSMVSQKFPTRAEISDIANAILDYADALMLSEETAIGQYPVLSVKTMEKICKFWEKKRELPFHFDFEINSLASAIAFSAWQLWAKLRENKISVFAFLVLTKKGNLARFLSRLKPQIPIFALTQDEKIMSQLSLYFGVIPCKWEGEIYQEKHSKEIQKILKFLEEKYRLPRKKRVILLFSEKGEKENSIFTIKIQETL